MISFKKNPHVILFVVLAFFSISFAGHFQTVSAQDKRQKVDTEKSFCEGCELLRQKKYAEAAKVFEKLIEIEPTRRGARTNLSWAYLELGRFDDAAATARKEISLYPGSSMAYNNLGFALTQLGKFEESIIEFQKAISLDFRNTKAHINLAYAFTSLNRYDDAVSTLEFLTETNPAYAPGFASLASAATLAGQKEKASKASRTYADMMSGSLPPR